MKKRENSQNMSVPVAKRQKKSTRSLTEILQNLPKGLTITKIPSVPLKSSKAHHINLKCIMSRENQAKLEKALMKWQSKNILILLEPEISTDVIDDDFLEIEHLSSLEQGHLTSGKIVANGGHSYRINPENYNIIKLDEESVEEHFVEEFYTGSSTILYCTATGSEHEYFVYDIDHVNS